jgi:hypothetical protein
MIDQNVIEQIERLLVENKISHRKIAKLTGISRGTIGAIALGRRQVRPKPIVAADEEMFDAGTPSKRCPRCGAIVRMPCRACHVKKIMDTSPTLKKMIYANRAERFVPVGLELKPVHRMRYEEVRRRRLENPELFVEQV